MGPGTQGETVYCGQWSSSEATERWTSSWPMMQKWMWPGARLDFSAHRFEDKNYQGLLAGERPIGQR